MDRLKGAHISHKYGCRNFPLERSAVSSTTFCGKIFLTYKIEIPIVQPCRSNVLSKNGVGLAGLPATLTSTMNGKSTSSFLTIQALIGKKSFYIGDPRNPLAQDLTIDTASTYQGRLNAKLEDDNYRLERANQDAALGLGIELAKQSAINAETLRMAGLYMREYNQGTYELASKLFVEQEEFNVFKLEIFGNCLRAMTGSQQTTTSQDNQASGFMQAVGATTAVVGLYNVLSTATGTAVVGEAVASVGVTIWEALFGTVAIAAA